MALSLLWVYKQYSYACGWGNVRVLPQGLSLHSMRPMASDPFEGVSWQVNYQGKPCYVAYCETEVLIISQDDGLPVANAVPRLSCELTDDDKKQLERLKLPQSSWNDDASIMEARCALDNKRHTMIKVERSKPGEWLCKTKVQQLIRNTMKASTKQACK